MGQSAVGNVVLVPFPYADFRRFKKRPALVLATVEFDCLILCQITSKPNTSRRALKLDRADFETGQLPQTSFIRPDKLFTADPKIIQGTIGKLNANLTNLALEKVRKIFS